MAVTSNKVALVTGGGRGIGLSTALAFARTGVSIVIADRSDAERPRVVDELTDAGAPEVLFVKTDVSSSTDVTRLFEQIRDRFGRLDYAFNNAGLEIHKPLLELEERDFDQTMQVNLKGAWLCLQQELTIMLEQKRGSIVFTSSVMASKGRPTFSLYTAAKAGIVGLARAAAIEVARTGVRINVVAPSIVKTPMAGEAFGAESLAAMASVNPSGRLAEPEEIARAVLWLCSDDSGYVTGHTLNVDGGLSVY
jgi:NAD(P)-dependent dehydrogenase (short-subunit alcohol dehydrogenase family)